MTLSLISPHVPPPLSRARSLHGTPSLVVVVAVLSLLAQFHALQSSIMDFGRRYHYRLQMWVSYYVVVVLALCTLCIVEALTRSDDGTDVFHEENKLLVTNTFFNVRSMKY